MISVTTDFEFIKSVVKNELVWPFVSDDNSDYDNYEPIETMAYLLAQEGENRLGFFSISPINSVCYEIHTTMLPEAWGKTVIYSKEVVKWIFENTKCMKIITFVPDGNDKALSLALRTGLVKEGYIGNSFLKNGKLIGQHILGINRGDVCQ